VRPGRPARPVGLLEPAPSPRIAWGPARSGARCPARCVSRTGHLPGRSSPLGPPLVRWFHRTSPALKSSQGRRDSAEVAGQAPLPDIFAVFGLQAASSTAIALDVEALAVDRRRTTPAPHFPAASAAPVGCPDRRPPAAPCRRLRTGPRRPVRLPGCSCHKIRPAGRTERCTRRPAVNPRGERRAVLGHSLSR